MMAEDGEAQHADAIFLRSCYSVIQGTEYLMELETPSNIGAIIVRTCDLLEKEKKQWEKCDVC